MIARAVIPADCGRPHPQHYCICRACVAALAVARAGASFNVSSRWIDYVHGPGADSGQALARELCALPANRRGQVEIPLSRPELLREVISVAELYIGGDDDRARAMQAARVIKRARRALADTTYGGVQ